MGTVTRVESEVINVLAKYIISQMGDDEKKEIYKEVLKRVPWFSMQHYLEGRYEFDD